MAKPAKIVPTKSEEHEVYTLVLSPHGVAITLAALKCLIDTEGHLMSEAENNAILDMVDEIKTSLNERLPPREEDA